MTEGRRMSDSQRWYKKVEVLGETDIACDNCGKENFVVTHGGEVAKKLFCRNCGQYVYYVGNFECVAYLTPRPTDREKVMAALGQQTLLPWATKYIKNMKRKLGL